MKKDDIKNIARLTCMSEEAILRSYVRPDLFSDIDDVQISNPDSPEKQLLGVIFAPDPRTGFATSDFSVFLSEKTAPEVRMYIQKYLFNQLPQVETGTFNPDVALDGTISTNVQSFADWRQVQQDLTEIIDLSQEEFKTWKLEHEQKS